MKILLISAQFTPIIGGIPTVVLLVARELVKLGHEIKVVTTTPATDADAHPYEVIRRPNALQLWRCYSWADACVMQGASLNLGWPIYLFKKPIFIVHQMWMYDAVRFPRLLKKLRVGMLRRSSSLAISSAIGRSLPVPSTPIPNPYDDEVFYINPNIARDKDLFFLGRLEEIKGAGDLIEALGILKRRGLEVTLAIAGYGIDREKLEAQVQQLGLAHLVEFLGPMSPGEKLTAMLNAHKIIAIPSRWEEPFGIVALEGIACGCVAIASNGGGLPEAIGPCGITFKNGDVQALADAIQTLLSDPAELERYRKLAPAHLEHYRARAVAESYLALLQDKKP